MEESFIVVVRSGPDEWRAYKQYCAEIGVGCEELSMEIELHDDSRRKKVLSRRNWFRITGTPEKIDLALNPREVRTDFAIRAEFDEGERYGPLFVIDNGNDIHEEALSILGDCALADVGDRVSIGVPIGIGDGFTLGNDSIIKYLFNASYNVCIGRNAMIGNDVSIGEDTAIGDGVRIGDGVVIGDGVTIGDFVTIGPNARIEAGTVIGEHSHIGSGTIIEQRAKIGSCSIMSDVYVGYDAKLGDETIIGAGAIICNNVAIEPGAKVAAGSIINHDVAFCATIIGSLAI